MRTQERSEPEIEEFRDFLQWDQRSQSTRDQDLLPIFVALIEKDKVTDRERLHLQRKRKGNHQDQTLNLQCDEPNLCGSINWEFDFVPQEAKPSSSLGASRFFLLPAN